MHRSNVPLVLENMAAFRKRFNMTKELKWSKITDQKLEEYKHLVEYFFAMSSQNQCHFKCIVFDSHQWRHHLYNDGDRDKGLSKLYYQLLLHKFCKRCAADESTLYVRLDHRNSSTSLNDLRDMLNRAARRQQIMHGPFKLIESADSKQCDILQLNDVILGAVCAARNGRHLLTTGRPAKAAMLEKSGLGSFEKDSPGTAFRFEVWNMKPRNGSAGPASLRRVTPEDDKATV